MVVEEDEEEENEAVGELESRLPGTTSSSNSMYTHIPKAQPKHFAHPDEMEEE
jgi:hypothetical protein